MTTRTAKRLSQTLVAILLALVAAGVILMLLELPPGQMKEGLKGIVFALGAVTAGLTTIYRIGRSMEKEEQEEEAREAHEQADKVAH